MEFRTSPPKEIVAVVSVTYAEMGVPRGEMGVEWVENMENFENELRSYPSLRRVRTRDTSNLPYDPARHTNGK